VAVGFGEAVLRSEYRADRDGQVWGKCEGLHAMVRPAGGIDQGSEAPRRSSSPTTSTCGSQLDYVDFKFIY